LANIDVVNYEGSLTLQDDVEFFYQDDARDSTSAVAAQVTNSTRSVGTLANVETVFINFNGNLVGTAGNDITTNVAQGGNANALNGSIISPFDDLVIRPIFGLNGDNSAWLGNLTMGNTTDDVDTQHIVSVGSSLGLSASNNVAMNHNATLQTSGNIVTIGNLSTLQQPGGTNDTYIENASTNAGKLIVTQTVDSIVDVVLRDGQNFFKLQPGEVDATLAFEKAGSASLSLTQASTYTGGTLVSGGTLLVNNTTGSGTGTGMVTVNSVATLGGNGFIGGATTISGTHSPGNSPGIITHNADLTYNSGANVIWELVDNTIGVRGTDFDGIDVNGNLDFAGATTLTLDFTTATGVEWNDPFWDSSYLGTSGWLVYSVTSGTLSNFGNLSLVTEDWVDGTPNNFSTFQAGNFSLFDDGSNNIYLNYTAVAVPEPTSLLMVGMGLLACGSRSRRRKVTTSR